MIFKKLDKMQLRYEKLQKDITQRPSPALKPGPEHTEKLKELAYLQKTLTLYGEYKTLNRDFLSCQKIVQTGTEDKELLSLASEELALLEQKKSECENKIKQMLLPKTSMDKKDVVVEIRPAAGGEEACLFCRDLFEMYSHYAEKRKWKTDILSLSSRPGGGFKELIFSIEGEGVYASLKHESGVHRVQRIPVTETQGRVHTSTVTVVVLPSADPVDVQIKTQDVRVDVFRSSGSGGQHVNTTDSAVRVVHLPTKITVQCQDEKSQHANREKAMKVLYARLYDRKMQEQQQDLSQQRLSQMGEGHRSEKIRTYNFPASRLTDHRAGLTLYNLDQIMKGHLDPLLQALNLKAAEDFLAQDEEAKT